MNTRRPDVVVVGKENNRALIAVPATEESTKKSNNKSESESEQKVDKYQDLASEIKRLWKVEAKVISIVIGALGTIPRGLKENLRTLGITIKVELIQKVALLGTARILRKVLDHR